MVKECVALVPTPSGKELVNCCGNQLQEALQLDVIFPVLHGTYGEDGIHSGAAQTWRISLIRWSGCTWLFHWYGQ